LLVNVVGFVQQLKPRTCFTRNDAMFAIKTSGEADIISVSGIISETTSFAEGKHHSKKPNLSGRQIRLFCWWT